MGRAGWTQFTFQRRRNGVGRVDTVYLSAASQWGGPGGHSLPFSGVAMGREGWTQFTFQRRRNGAGRVGPRLPFSGVAMGREGWAQFTERRMQGTAVPDNLILQ